MADSGGGAGPLHDAGGPSAAIRLLGSLEVIGPDGPVEIRGAKRRALVALLALRAPDVVPLDVIVESLWGSDAHDGARGTVQTYISQLRRLLPDPLRIVTRGGGYGLDCPSGSIDAVRFDELTRDARTTDASGRLDRVEEALALWRGDPLTEFAGQPWADEQSRAFAQRYLSAQSSAVDALLDLGRHDEALPRVERLVAAHPLIERLWAQLMLARYRSGQQAAALRAFQELRATLAEELGIEPSPEIVRLERRILDHDPELAAPALARREGSGHEHLPDGTVTFLLTDIADSTALWDRHPVEMERALVAHEALVDAIVTRHAGHMIKARGEGDSTFCVFARPTDALDAAIDLQREIRTDETARALELRVRVGVHTGQAQLRSGDYYGGTVNRAARVRGVAPGDQILVSRTTHDLVVDVLPDGVDLIELGAHSLKGLQRVETIYAVAHPDLAPIDLPAVTGAPGTAAGPTGPANAPAIPLGANGGGETPLVGRDAELSRLLPRLGVGGIALLGGEPGIGKTRLAVEVAMTADRAGRAVAWGACPEDDRAQGLPAWQAIARTAIGVGGVPPDAASDLARLVPDLIPGVSASAADDPGAIARLGTAIAATLVRAEVGLVVLDDLQWADSATASLLALLSADRAVGDILFIGTFRAGDARRSAPLADLLAALARHDRSERINLTGLAPDAIRELVTRTAGARADDALTQLVCDRSDGNPFYVRELVRLAIDDRTDIPDGVHAVLARRLRLLGDGPIETMTAAAVLGRDFAVDDVEAVAELEPDRVDDDLDEAADAQLIDGDGNEWRFVHALVREVLLADARPSRIRALHRRAAQRLESRGDADRFVPEIAAHWLAGYRAADAPRVVVALLRAARLATQQLLHAEAVGHFDAALDVIERHGADPEAIGDALLGRGLVRMRTGRIDDGRDDIERAGELARERGDFIRLADAAISYKFSARVESADPRERALIDAALDLAPADADPTTLALLHGHLADWLSEREPLKRVEALRAREYAAVSGDPRAAFAAARAIIWTTLTPARFTELADAAELAVRVVTAAAAPEAQIDARMLQLLALGQLGDSDAYAENVDRMDALAMRLDIPLARSWAAVTRSRVHLGPGRLADAEHALEAAATTDDVAVLLAWGGQTVNLRRWQGRPGEACPLVFGGDSDELPPDVLAMVLGLRGALLTDLGETSDAQMHLDRLAADAWTSLSPDGAWARQSELALAAEIAEGCGDTRRAAELTELLAPWAEHHIQQSFSIYLGPGAHYLGLVHRAVGDLSLAADLFQQAATRATDIGATTSQLLALAELATTLMTRRGSGDEQAATALAKRVRVDAEPLGLARVLGALPDGSAAPGSGRS